MILVQDDAREKWSLTAGNSFAFEVSLTDHGNGPNKRLVLHVGYAQSAGYERYDILVVPQNLGGTFVLCFLLCCKSGGAISLLARVSFNLGFLVGKMGQCFEKTIAARWRHNNDLRPRLLVRTPLCN